MKTSMTVLVVVASVLFISVQGQSRLLKFYLTMPGAYCDPRSFGNQNQISSIPGQTIPGQNIPGQTIPGQTTPGQTGNIPGFPITSGVTGLTGFPGLTGIPGLAGLPGIPGLTGIPGLGGVPGYGSTASYALFGELGEGLSGILQLLALTGGDSSQLPRLLTCRRILMNH